MLPHACQTSPRWLLNRACSSQDSLLPIGHYSPPRWIHSRFPFPFTPCNESISTAARFSWRIHPDTTSHPSTATSLPEDGWVLNTPPPEALPASSLGPPYNTFSVQPPERFTDPEKSHQVPSLCSPVVFLLRAWFLLLTTARGHADPHRALLLPRASSSGASPLARSAPGTPLLPGTAGLAPSCLPTGMPSAVPSQRGRLTMLPKAAHIVLIISQPFVLFSFSSRHLSPADITEDNLLIVCWPH